MLSSLLFIFSCIAIAQELNLTLNAKLNSYDNDFITQTDGNATSGFDTYDFPSPSLPDNYSEFYSKVGSTNLSVDVWNKSVGQRIFNLTYHTSNAESGSLNLSWNFSDPNFEAKITDYGYDPTYTTPNDSQVDMKSLSEYKKPVNGSDRYFKLEVFSEKPNVTSVILNSSSGTNYTNENLTAYVTANDINNHNLTIVYNWYKNDNLNATTLITDGLVSYWPFNNDTLDYYGNNDGTAINGAFLNYSGQIGGAYQFDGSDDLINLSKSLPVLESQNVTIYSWIYINSFSSAFLPIVTQYDYGLNGYYLYVYSNTTKPAFYIGCNYDLEAVSPDSINSNEWHNLVGTNNGTDLIIYVDGTKKANVSSAGCNGTVYNAYIGGDYVEEDFFNGLIDEVMIFNRSLSESEIKMLYDGSKLGGNKLDNNLTTKYDAWKIGAKAADYMSWSQELNSSNVTIRNSVPTFDQNLTAQNVSANGSNQLIYDINCSDLDNDTLTYYVNTSLVDINYSTGLIIDTPTGAENGTYSIEVKCGDGDVNSTATFIYIILDDSKPIINITEPDPGEILGWTITLMANVTDDGVGIKNASYRIINSTGSIFNSSSVTANSWIDIWSTTNDTVPYGNYTLIIEAYDNNLNYATANVTFIVDNNQPSIQIIEPDQTNRFRNNNFNLNLMFSNEHLLNVSYTISSGQQNSTSFSYPGATNANFTDLVNVNSLSEGNYTINVSAVDFAGNLNNKTEWFYVDKTNPTVQSTWLAPTPANNTYTKINTQTFNMSCSDSFIDVVYIDFNGTINDTPQTDSFGNYWWTFTLTEGNYTYIGYCNDTAGNSNSTETRILHIDLTLPFLNITFPEAAPYNYHNHTLNFTVYDTFSGLDKCWKRLNNGANITINCSESTTVNSSTEGTIEGDNYIYMWANDTAGNVASDLVYFVISTHIPAIYLNYPEEDEIINTNTVNFSFRAVDKDGMDTCKLWGNWTGIWSLNQTFSSYVNDSITIAPKFVADGTYKWNVQCNDSFNNTAWHEANHTFYVDATYPLISIVYPVNGTVYEINVSNLNYTVSDNNLDKCWYSLNNGATNSTPGSCNNFTGLSGINGWNNWTVYVNDTAGNVNSSNVTFYSTYLTDCLTLNQANHNYYVWKNISTTATCFIITADNITLDGNGYLLKGDDSSEISGIYANGQKNITIKNMIITDFSGVFQPQAGISFQAVDYSRIDNVTVTSGTWGIFVKDSTSDILSNLLLHDIVNEGIRIYSSTYCNLTNITIHSISSGAGLSLYGGANYTRVDNLTVYSSYGEGIVFYGGSSNNSIINANSYSNGEAINSYSGGDPNLNNQLVYNNSFGQIKWINQNFLDNLDINGALTYPGNIIIGNNSAYLNSNAFTGQAINSSANITLYGIGNRGFATPTILKDGINCPANQCYNFTSLTATDVIFNVTSWSNYSIGEDTIKPIINIVAPITDDILGWTVVLWANVTDSNLATVRYEIQNGTLGSAVIASGLMNYIGGDIFNATLITNDSWPYNIISRNSTNLTLVVYANDTSNNLANASSYWVLDNTKPGIEYLVPSQSGNFYNSNFNLNIQLGNHKLNYSEYNITRLSDLTIVKTNSTNLASAIYTWTNLINVNSLSEGNYSITTYANDSSNPANENNKTTWFYVKKTPPNITASGWVAPTPDNNTYTNIQTNIFNMTCSETFIDQIWIDMNGTIDNTPDGSDGTHFWWTFILGEGSYDYTGYCNDSAGNLNNTETRTLNIDLTSPQYSNVGTTPASITNSDTVYLNVTWIDSFSGMSYVNFSHNATGTWENYTASGIGNYYVIILPSNLSNGEVIGWYSYAVDNVGNKNETPIQSFTVGNRLPNTTEVILNSTLGRNFTNEDLKCYENTTDEDLDSAYANYTWYLNGSYYSSGQIVVPLGVLTEISTISSNVTEIGDTWTCSIQSYDGASYEGDWNNASLLIIPGCGDIIVQSGEECDGSNLNNKTCNTLNYDGGSLSCNTSCNFNKSGCTIDSGCSPSNSAWSAWSSWSDTSDWNTCTSCSQSKTQSRTRSCVGTASCGGTNGCTGSSTETQTVSQACGVIAGGWSTTWSTCDISCTQTKLCNNPTPSCGGATCSGSTPTQSCTGGDCCQIDCSGKSCGDNGCGGSCGTCSSGSCQNGQCVVVECDDDDDCGESYECKDGECVYEEPPKELLAPEDIEKEKNMSVIACINITRMTGTTEVSVEEGQIDPSLIPEGYSVVVNPFHMDCTGEDVKFTVAIPENYEDIKVLKCNEGSCSSEQAEYVTELKCGDSIVEEVKRESKIFDPKLEAVDITETQVNLSQLKEDIASGNSSVKFLGEELSGIVSIQNPKGIIEEAKNPYMKILGSPIVIEFKETVEPGVNSQVTLPYTTSENYEESSIAMYIKQDGNWIYIENSTINYDEKLVTSTIENIGQYLDNENKVTLALMGVLIVANKDSELKNAYYPLQGTRDMLIFVHGVGSSPQTYQSMIDDIRLTKQPISIYTFGYSLTKTIDEIAADFSNILETSSNDYDNIYIVAHSAGGLVVQQALYDADRSGTYNYIKKVKKAILIAAPNDGSPLAAVYKRLFQNMVNEDEEYPVFNIKTETMDELVKGRIIPQVQGIDYYVIAGTKPYELNVALFKENTPFQQSEVSDGVVTIKSAQHIGESYISNRGKNYWEIYLTHNELIKDPLARKIIEKIIARDILKIDSILGSSQYYDISITGCNPNELYVVIGIRVPRSEVVDPTLFECGNGICSNGEDKNNCPEDCALLLSMAKKEDILPIIGYGLGIIAILFLIMEALARIRLIIYAKTKANKNDLMAEFNKLTKSAEVSINKKDMVIADKHITRMKKNITILQYITPRKQIVGLKLELNKIKEVLNNVKSKEIHLYREQLAQDTQIRRQHAQTKSFRKKEKLPEKLKPAERKKIIETGKIPRKNIISRRLLRKIFQPNITVGYIEHNLMKLHDLIEKCNNEINNGRMIHPNYQVKLFLRYEDLYADTIESNITSKQKAALSKKLKTVYDELKSIQKQKPRSIPKEIRREKVKTLIDYKVSSSKQLKDLTKRYEKLNKTIEGKKLSIHEELDSFMNYSKLYSDLAMSSINENEKTKLGAKLSRVYQKMKKQSR